MPFTIDQIAQLVGGEIRGSSDFALIDVAPLETATTEHVSYLESKKQLKLLLSSSAGVVLTTDELAARAQKQGCQSTFIIVAAPQAAFIEVMLQFRPQPEKAKVGISDLAVIDETAQIGAGTQIYPHAYIGKNVTLGENCHIGPGAVIEDGCTLGNNCTVHANAVLYREISLGQRVIIHANAVIGADGFGYRFVDGAFVRIPHTGTVIIEDDVEIGAAATVDRGMINATVIGQGTKLDNQVMVAHNCQIGKHNAFASQVGLAGSCTTGDYVQMGGQVGVADHVNIGTGAKFGGKCGVIWDMPAGGTYHGIPAIQEKEAIRNHFSLQKLPELREQIKALSAQLEELQSEINQSQPPSSTEVNNKAA